MPGRRDFLIIGGVGAAAAIAGALLGPLVLRPEAASAELLSARFPDLAGVPRQLLDWQGQGKVLVCNFWATWCVPCQEEVPLLVETSSRFAPKGVEVVGIGIDHADKLRQFAKDFHINYPVLVADAYTLDLMRKLGNQAGALPYTVVVNRAGTIAYRRLGILRQADLYGVLEGLLS